ncbi:MAG TPA: hypothetical protein VMI75_06895 [Polyangiaceae bacterium]|nr:hypothetical protein [Polyangiaceae bacterium]
MKRKRRERSVEDVFPNARARQAADEAIGKLDPKETMTKFLDTWEAAYFAVAGCSPFRKP